MRREDRSNQSRSLTNVKTVAVFLSSVLLCYLMVNISLHSLTHGFSFLFISSLFLGYIFADLMTGTVHWFCDSFFSEKTPIIGNLIISPFREHHLYPHLITEDKFIEQDTTSFFLFMPFLYQAVFIQNNYLDNPKLIHVHFLLIGLCIGTFCTNLFHKWAHQKNENFLILGLQKLGLILNFDNHKKHHNDHSKSYCVTSGILNPILDYLRFFPTLELVIRSFLNGFRK
tara:strand:- start:1180 stop:1863 length:684 start_codon:yes stop_codon:yes gene_type:complete